MHHCFTHLLTLDLTVSGDESSIYFDGAGDESSNENQDIYLHVYFGMSPGGDYVSKLRDQDK